MNDSKPYPPQREIRAAMALRGLSVKDVHVRTGISYGYLVRLLNGYATSRPAIARIRAGIGIATLGLAAPVAPFPAHQSEVRPCLSLAA